MPCGAQVQVLVPLGAALGVTDEVAEVTGHGPVDGDLLAQRMLAAPALRPVWIDEHGVPVAGGARLRTVRRGDAADVRRSLLELARQRPPDRLHPRHLHDHHPPRPPDRPVPQRRAGPDSQDGAGGDDVRGNDAGANGVREAGAGGDGAPAGHAEPAQPSAPAGAHPARTPGSYQPPRQLRRLLTTRAPLCEWPGCGARSTRCDLDHDRAWPGGATCACNLGPLCRRHHRCKQQGWVKHRSGSGSVRWTGPTGRTVTSPAPYQPAATPVRGLPPLPAEPDPYDLLGPLEFEDEMYSAHPDHPMFHDLDHAELCSEPDPDDPAHGGDDIDTMRRSILSGASAWTLGLADPYAWLQPPLPPPGDRDDSTACVQGEGTGSRRSIVSEPSRSPTR